jgi:dTDP-4-amino-4,6-dideoxygalactose transaminase
MDMKIPFFDLKRQYGEIAPEVEQKVLEVMRSGQYVEGAAVKELESQLAEYIGVKHVITCGNGTDSLRIALMAAGVSQNDEVITTSFSFFATAEAIAQVGAVPVFADIDMDTLNISVDSIKQKVTAKTKAILPVHIFGLPADMDEINKLAAEINVPVIEDSCQGIGASYKGKKAGNLGTIGCFSFYPTKNLGGMGDGGMITTNDDETAKVCRALKAHAAGRNGAEAYQHLYHDEVKELENLNVSGDSLYDPCKYFNYFIGGNSRLDSIQAAVLSVKLKHLDEYNAKRAAIAKKYSESLKGLPLQLPSTTRSDRQSCWHQYAVLCDKKEEFTAYMSSRGIGTGAFYPVPLHLQKAFKNLGYHEGMLQNAENVCRKSVCLPIFPELRDDETDYIIEEIYRFFKREV